MNNQTETINSGAVSNNTGTAANITIPESAPTVADKPKTATDQGNTSNVQPTNQSDLESQTTPDEPTSVKLELSEEQADMIQTLLSNYVLAYRSDRSVDYKPEPIPREKVGQYPWVATPPAPEIINPKYDWINKKWYSKTGATSLPEIAQAVKNLQSDQQAGTTQNLALTKAVKALSEGQANQNKLLASMQNLMLQMASQKQATPAQPSTDTKQENGGN